MGDAGFGYVISCGKNLQKNSPFHRGIVRRGAMRDVRKILNILSGRYADLSRMNWYWGLGFLKFNRIGASFLRLARECGAELPKQVEKVLKEETENQKQRNDAIRPWIEDISTLLKGSKAVFAFLKGSVLAYCTMGGKKIYPSGERVFNDVDILTTSSHLDKIDSVLRSLGFIQGEWVDGEIKPFSRREILFRRMSRGETAPYLVKTQAKAAPYIEVDVNFSLDCVPQKDGELVEEMLKNTVLYQFSPREELCSLTPEKFFCCTQIFIVPPRIYRTH